VLVTHDGESSAVGFFCRCLASSEIGIGLSVGFELIDEPRFTCPLIKTLATRTHCLVTHGRPELDLIGPGLRSIQHSPPISQLNS
jgi:hypothetical protein